MGQENNTEQWENQPTLGGAGGAGPFLGLPGWSRFSLSLRQSLTRLSRYLPCRCSRKSGAGSSTQPDFRMVPLWCSFSCQMWSQVCGQIGASSFACTWQGDSGAQSIYRCQQLCLHLAWDNTIVLGPARLLFPLSCCCQD